MTNKNIGERIAKRRTALDMTMDEVAKRVGVARSTIQRYETGKIQKIKLPVIESIATALNVNPDWIIGNTENPDPKMPIERASVHSEIIQYTPTHRIPILGRISAGLPLYAEEHIEGYTYTEMNGGAEYFALRVSGDSMNAARIQEGDLLIVRRQDLVENGEIAVVIVGDDEATVKRFYKSENIVTLMPQSTNPSHQAQIYDTLQTSIRILGLVVKNEIAF